jgi:RNA polymerase sigma factor (sigma-70 family)
MTAIAARTTDLELVHRVREGDNTALGELWNRYQGWAHRVARGTTTRFDSQDIVQEAFTKVLIALTNGKGPTRGFGTYLAVAVRTVAATWGVREARLALVPLEDDSALGSHEFEVADLGDLEQPFRSLPERWRRVVVLTCLYELPAGLVAEEMGMTAGAVSALALRARRGLREALVTAREDPALAG